MMQYKGYMGEVEFDDEAGLFHGQVINVRDVITFQGRSVAELRKAFVESVDDYLAFCAERGEDPDRPFSGRFVARVSPDLHRRLNTAARMAGKSLNAYVSDQLDAAVRNDGVAGEDAPRRRRAGGSNTKRPSRGRSTRSRN